MGRGDDDQQPDVFWTWDFHCLMTFRERWSVARAAWWTRGMPGMRRRLRGMTTRVSGAKQAATANPSDEGPDLHAEPPVSETDGVPALTEPSVDVPAEPVVEIPEGPVVAVDAVCAAAVDLARTVAVEVAGSSVGDHLGVEADDELVVTHSFATTDPAYVGWRWAVTVARADGSSSSWRVGH